MTSAGDLNVPSSVGPGSAGSDPARGAEPRDPEAIFLDQPEPRPSGPVRWYRVWLQSEGTIGRTSFLRRAYSAKDASEQVELELARRWKGFGLSIVSVEPLCEHEEARRYGFPFCADCGSRVRTGRARDLSSGETGGSPFGNSEPCGEIGKSSPHGDEPSP